ncbi:MAG: ATP-binding protein [Myxococcota bacterium]
MMFLRSLRTRLLVLLVATSASTWGAAAWWIYRDTHHQVDALFDAQLAQSARLLLAQASHELAEEDDDEEGKELDLSEGRGHPYERRIHFQVWDRSGRLRFRSSRAAPTTPLTQHDSGFSDENVNGAPWRVFALWDRHHRVQIQIGQEHRVREELSRGIVARTMAPALVGLMVLAVLMGWAVRRALQPLNALAREVERRAPEHMAPLEVAQVPTEVDPLVRSLNTLLRQLDRALAAERQFTADAAHELRTPLAAIKAQAQVAQASPDEETRRHALSQLVAAVDRTTHLVQQLLTLARLDPQQTLPERTPTDVRAVTREVLAELAPAALDRNTELVLHDGPTPTISGNTALVATLIRNLVDNAIRHSPTGGTVAVRVQDRDGAVELEVTDQGPGIPPDERERVFQRFYRAAGAAEGGSGLGLAIVQRIAELHGATVLLEPAGPGVGLRVRVRWPSA